MFSSKFTFQPKLSFSKALSLPSRTQIELIDRGLRSINGAKQIIEAIRSRRTITKLILGHNSLSDDGCVLLFTFLSSPLGRKYPITEISLNANNIGDRGLAAIAAYLVNNTTLTELFLQDNSFTADPTTVLQFSHAINRSRLRLLSLTTNRLTDDFANLFFPSLCSHYLQELHLSAVGLTHSSASYIAEFITSPGRCQLQTLKCNGNNLAFCGVRALIRAIERANFSLTVVELYSNNIASGQDSDTNDGETDSYSLEAWKDMEKLLKQALGRNSYLKRATRREALQLLVASRTVLLRSQHPFNYDASPNKTSTAGFPFRDFPTEIQLHVLSFLAPTLSAIQRVRIFTYASSPSTLPGLLPSLSSTSRLASNTEPAIFSMCAPDPSVTMEHAGPSGPVWYVNDARAGEGCTPGKCMGRKSLICHLDQKRTAWLEEVGCLAYDPGPESGMETLS